MLKSKHFDPGMNAVNWKALAQSRRDHSLTRADPEAFEREVHKDLRFAGGESASLLIEKLSGGHQRVNVQLPLPKSQNHPVTAPEAGHARKLTDDIGLLTLAMFPGAIGIDSARDMTEESRHSMVAADRSSICVGIREEESVDCG